MTSHPTTHDGVSSAERALKQRDKRRTAGKARRVNLRHQPDEKPWSEDEKKFSGSSSQPANALPEGIFDVEKILGKKLYCRMKDL